jgi:hypothetical protein
MLGLCAADLATPQPFAPLPTNLSGRWTYVFAGGRTVVDSVSITFDVLGEQGQVAGRLSHRGVNCGALDEPFTGTWNGAELRIEARMRANVNTARNGGTCPSSNAIYTLKRAAGGDGFAGEVIMEGMTTPAQVTLAPGK